MKKSVKNKIIFSAQDPGGFNAIWPVIKEIKGFEYRVLLVAESKKIASEKGIEFINCDNLAETEIWAILGTFEPRVVVCGTSDGLSLEKKIIFWAKKNSVKSLAIVDFWSNYRMRFSNPGTDDLSFLPDTVCVIDKKMEKEMIEEGFNSACLKITGNPFFDTFEKKSSRGKYILFAEQPFSEFSEQPEFSEIEILADFINAFEAIGISLPVIVSLHPRCKKADKFDKIMKSAKIKIYLTQQGSDKLVAGAALVTGINTMVLFRAALEGKKVLSYQPGSNKEKDMLRSNDFGWSRAVYKKEDLAKAIKDILKKNGRDHLKTDKYLENNSIQKVINLIKKII